MKDYEEFFDAIVTDSEEAICIHDYGQDKDIWLPKSQIEIEEIANGIIIKMPEWLAKEKELI
uniref:Uncharacterized protein n=1 Tax=viral metagenome TaxID=1070528 RepID=A0A6H1ZVA2_9ZZZZ